MTENETDTDGIGRLSDKLRKRVRAWLLTDSEREIVESVEELETEVEETKQEWWAVKEALDSADVWGDPMELDEVDILVVGGRDNVVQGAEFNDAIYVAKRSNAMLKNIRVDTTSADTKQSGGDGDD